MLGDSPPRLLTNSVDSASCCHREATIGRPVPVRRLPVVLSRDEVAAVLGGLQGVHRVLARLLYGTGMRISEGLQTRGCLFMAGTGLPRRSPQADFGPQRHRAEGQLPVAASY